VEGSLARQTLEHDGAHTPQVGLTVVLVRHDHLGRLTTTQCITHLQSFKPQRRTYNLAVAQVFSYFSF
jgi:hypothetical protein